MWTPERLKMLVFLSGVGQIILIVASLAIPVVLKWKEELQPLKNNLIRQMFWVYSAYIWGTNLCFGIVSAFAPHWLIEKTPLAVLVCAFICLYWGARVLIQFFYFDRSCAPQGFQYLLAEFGLVLLFIWLTFVYGAVAVINGAEVFA